MPYISLVNLDIHYFLNCLEWANGNCSLASAVVRDPLALALVKKYLGVGA